MTAVAPAQPRTIDDLRGLYRDLHRLGVDLREASLRLQEMVRAGRFAAQGEVSAYTPDDPADTLNRSIDITRNFEFLVAVTGAFSSGKSTLLNLLLDHRDLLPASVIPMTAVCTVIRHGSRPAVDVRYASLEESFARARACLGSALTRPFHGPEHLAEARERPQELIADPAGAASLRRFAELLARFDEIRDQPVWFDVRAPFIAGGGVLPEAGGRQRYFRPTPNEEQEYLAQGGDPRRWVTREWLALIRDVSLRVPAPLLENDIVLLDLPGLNCREDYHRRAIREYCNRADCILVTAFQPGNQADADVIASFKKLSSSYHDKIFFVFNKVDQFAQEPGELAHAVDYLARDTIGSDFPRDRFFLTSAQLARAASTRGPSWQHDLSRLRAALVGVADSLPGLEGWVDQVTAEDDPGGVGCLRSSLCAFLVEDAYRTKVAEVVHNYRAVLEALRTAASPTFEESLHMDATDVLRRSVLDYFRYVEKLHASALQRFRSEYLRGHESNGAGTLRHDLNGIFEHIHRETHKVIRGYFDQPILSAPLVEDPVNDFDLLTIADKASRHLRRELQEMLIGAVHTRVNRVFREYLDQSGSAHHLERVLRGAPERLRRVEAILARASDTMRHSHRCIVGTRFFQMPRGRQLQRLARPVPLGEMKDLLIEVFVDFYPAWLYENVYADLVERLWLALFLDSEELEQELEEFFRATEGVVTGRAVAEQVRVPARIAGEQDGLYRSLRMCRQIADLLRRHDELKTRAASLGVAS